MKARSKDTLLLIGSADSDRSNLHNIFASRYHLLETETPAQGIFLLGQNSQYIAAVLVDIPLITENNEWINADELRSLVEVCQPNTSQEIPVLAIVTPTGTGSAEEYAFIHGVADVVLKPYTTTSICRRVQVLVDLYQHQWQLERLVQQQNDTIRNTNQVMVDTLSAIIEHRNTESGNHILRIRRFTQILLQAVSQSYPEYGLDDNIIEKVTSAASLHDIGKISIPDGILNKPGQLTPEEFEIMKTHTTVGGQLVEQMGNMGDTLYLRYMYNIALYHHERWDGKGYPHGLAGDQIPICAQVVGLTDAYDALTTHRVYKPALPHTMATNMILNGECGVFSPKVLECFKRVRADFEELSRLYADGYSPKSDNIRVPLPGPEQKIYALSAMQLSQLKYQTLLHHLNDTVIEMDLDNQIYHVVYNPNPDFVSLLNNISLLELRESLFRDASHPDDACDLARHLTEGFRMLFQQDMRNYSFHCRLFSPPDNIYRPYQVSIQKISTHNPNQRILLMIFHLLTETTDIPSVPRMDSLENSSAMYDLTNAALRCAVDERLTILDGTNSLMALTRYFPNDIWGLFGNSLLQMVHAEDRQRLVSLLHNPEIHCGRVEGEFRIHRKDGSVLWVLCRARAQTTISGEDCRFLTLTDIDAVKKKLDMLESAVSQHELLAMHSGNILLRWDVATDTLQFSGAWQHQFGDSLNSKAFSKYLHNSARIHPDDWEGLRNLTSMLLSGTHTSTVDARIVNKEGKYLWKRIRGVAVHDKNGAVSTILAVMYDIDKLKTDTLSLEIQTQRDALTGLLNKASTQKAISTHLAHQRTGSTGALLLLDLDNFKQVNDSLGHMYGDAVLTRVGTSLKNLFREQDIIGRIGGDEFMIFLQNLPSKEVAEERCRLLVNVLREQFKQLMPSLPVSVSIGAVLVSEQDHTYQELYRHADEALYTAKRKGKNQYKFYTKADQYDVMITPASRSTQIDSDSHQRLNQGAVTRFFFHSLYESKDVEKTINELLAFLGTHFNVSRAYIFENSDDNTHCSNTFEWCNTGVTPEKDHLQDLSYETDMPNWPEVYTADGMLYCTDISQLEPKIREIVQPQGIKSMLHCAMMNQGVFRGFVGFDECTANYLWTQEQVDHLRFLAEVLAVYLIKHRITVKLQKYENK